MLIDGLLLAGMLLCAVQAIHAKYLLESATWLAGLSALLSLTLYRLGAQTIAVIELSVGAGLVTVLFVFAISIIGENTISMPSRMPVGLMVLLCMCVGVLQSLMVIPLPEPQSAAESATFAETLWEQRGLDVAGQMIMIFAGAITMLWLLREDLPAVELPPQQKEIQEAHR